MNRLISLINSSLVVTLGLATVMVAVPISAAAQTSTTEAGFCKNTDSIGTKIDAQISASNAKLIDARTKRDQDMSTHRSKWIDTVTADRAKWDSQRSEQFSKLEVKAATDTEKTAIQTYETAIKSAVATRRSAHDANREVFFNGVDSLLSTSRQVIDGQVSALRTSVASSISTAKASCAAGTASASVRQVFVASIKSAREAFKTSRQSDTKIEAQIDTLNTSRIASNKTADQTFQNSADSARTVLKTAFGKDASKV